jgi:anaerobic magnesium-protoporphyrin IX monomethyl ester cyclase
MRKVLFVVPPYDWFGVQSIGSWPPLQLAYMAAVAEDHGFEARIFDAMNQGLGFDDVRSRVAEYRPDVVVAFDYMPVTGAIATATVPAALEALKIAKDVASDIVTIIGGPHPTFLYQETLGGSPQVDYVLRGEVEETFGELLDAMPSGDVSSVQGIAYRAGDGEIVATPMRPHIADLDGYKPAWHLLDWSIYRYNVEPYGRVASVLTSRGCMMGCAFCSHRQFWRGDWRARSPQDVIAEIEELVDTHDVRVVTLIDPYPTNDRERWEKLLDLIIEADLDIGILMETRVEDVIRDADLLPKYRDAGVIHLYLGAEGSTDEMLSSLNKGTDVDTNKRALDLAREHGILTEASFMIGGPEETWDSIESTIEVAMRLNPDIAVFPVLTPMPFTPIAEQYKDRIRVHDYSQYDLSTPIIEPYEMTLEDVTVAMGKCYMTFYANKMREVVAMPDSFHKRYMMSAFKAMMRGYGRHFEHMGLKMPKMPSIPGLKP